MPKDKKAFQYSYCSPEDVQPETKRSPDKRETLKTVLNYTFQTKDPINFR